MSFDLYFVRYREGATDEELMEELELAASQPRTPTADDVALWSRIATRVTPLFAGPELFTSERHRELTDVDTGIQVSMFPDELSVSVPYWYSGDEARTILAKLKAVAAVIESETGLTAYDPQSSRPFLEGGVDAAPAVFEQVHDAFAGDAEPPDVPPADEAGA